MAASQALVIDGQDVRDVDYTRLQETGFTFCSRTLRGAFALVRFRVIRFERTRTRTGFERARRRI
jgi:hypothetical protein